ncbi:MAG: Gfo/Idh/MocA family protein [Janthinobacterium lividum]
MRIGLVGYGFGGRFFHAPLLTSLADAKLVGVVTRSDERRQQLSADHPGVPAFDSIGQLVEAGVDLLVICTPLPGRAALIQEAFDHGIAVVSDKPFAFNATEASALIAAAHSGGAPFTVYQNRRWDSDFLTVRKLIAEGTLGTVSHFESRFERYSPQSLGDTSAGGVLLDLGSHLVDQALQLFGAVETVYGELYYSPQAPDVDYGFFVALRHRSGVVSHLYGNKLQDAEPRRFRVTGSNGTYCVEGLDGQEEATLAGRSPRSEGERWGVEEHRRWGWFERGAEREKVRSEHGNWPRFYGQVVEAIKEGRELPVALDEALLTVRVLDAARLSSVRRQVVKLTDDGSAERI